MPAVRAFWQGLDRLLQTSVVVVDRPRGSAHPDYPQSIYPLDYGYLEGTMSGDGGGIDVWIGAGGAGGITGMICTVDLLKRDTEIKLLLGCDEDEMQDIMDFMQDDAMSCLLVLRQPPER